MATLSPDQRNYYYLLESERTGIHQPILAALYQTHSSPSLSDGQTGLGISPANRVSLSQVNTFPEQVQYAAKGDARDFVCEGLTGNQLYWTLDPWWIGGLARFINFPNLCHIDARSYRARWLN